MIITAIIDDCREAAAGYAVMIQQWPAHTQGLAKMQFDANQAINKSMQETNKASWDSFNRTQKAWRRNL